MGITIYLRPRVETGETDLFWLTDEQMEHLRPFLTQKPPGKPRVDDRRVLSGIELVKRTCCAGEIHPSPTVPTRRSTIGGGLR